LESCRDWALQCSHPPVGGKTLCLIQNALVCFSGTCSLDTKHATVTPRWPRLGTNVPLLHLALFNVPCPLQRLRFMHARDLSPWSKDSVDCNEGKPRTLPNDLSSPSGTALCTLSTSIRRERVYVLLCSACSSLCQLHPRGSEICYKSPAGRAKNGSFLPYELQPLICLHSRCTPQVAHYTSRASLSGCRARKIFCAAEAGNQLCLLIGSVNRGTYRQQLTCEQTCIVLDKQCVLKQASWIPA
jgi:hypothetical protein